MALLPAIPARPADRPETSDEYQRRRAIVVMWRRFNDDLILWLRSEPLPPFDPFDWFYRGAGAAAPRLPFSVPAPTVARRG